MPDHAILNLHDQFMTLIYMKLHAQNQLYTSFSFSDLKVSIASLGMSDPTYFNRYAPPCKKSTLYHK